MKQRTRDNLIYLIVGTSIVALVVADLAYADSHNEKMWWPSKLASRAAYTTALLAYFVAREARKARGKLPQVLGCVLFASILHLAIIFAVRGAVDNLPGLSFATLALFEIFLVLQLSMLALQYVKSG